MGQRVRRWFTVAVVLVAAMGVSFPTYANGSAALAGLSNFTPLASDDLGSLDGMGGKYLDSLPPRVIEQLSQLQDLQTLLIDASKKTQIGNVGISDEAFHHARGIMALIQIAGNYNMVDLHVHLNIFLGGTFIGGDFRGDWIDVGDLFRVVETR